MQKKTMIKAGIVGASGYSGRELMRLLSAREDVSLACVTAHASAGQRVDALYPSLAGAVDLTFGDVTAPGLEGLDVVFVALPSGEGMKVVPGLREKAGRVIDLGGDFRLKSTADYEHFYKRQHTAPELLNEAVYGLPELNKARIATATLVSNPGCYPTSAILALAPALRHGVIAREGIVINALSGVSGAGRSSSVEMSFAELNENVRAYKVGTHQHIPEIESVLSESAGAPVSVSFIPHLIPITRGIYTTIHAQLTASLTEAELFDLYETFYADAPFVRIKRQIPQIQSVDRTNYCDLWLSLQPRTKQLLLISVIDNLVKGAAGQALQNMNIMFGLAEGQGLH